jgi:cell division protein FtsN
MEEETTSRPRARQILWIGAGVAILTVLVLAGSWLFSPRAPNRSAAPPATGLKEEEVQKQTFQPETPQRLPGVPAPSVPEPERAPLERATEPAPQEPQNAGPPQAEAAPAEPPAPVLKEPSSRSAASGAFGVQVGAFASQANARDMVSRLRAAGFKSSVLQKGGKFKVVVGGFADRPSAEKTLADMRRAGFTSAFVVPLEEP